jgi:hypothetical protein
METRFNEIQKDEMFGLSGWPSQTKSIGRRAPEGTLAV